MPQWYDSRWLAAYFAARDIIANVAPQKLREFEEGLSVFQTDSSFVPKKVTNLFEFKELEEIRQAIREIPKEKIEMHELKRFGRFIVHNWPLFSELQLALVDRVSELAGERVEPSYNFLSLYTKLGVCEPHLDAPTAKWTLDVCLDQSAPWPIYFSEVIPWAEAEMDLGEDWQNEIKNEAGISFTPEVLTPGNAILFSGSSQWHYRNAIPAEKAGKHFCDLLFFHFIPEGKSEIVQPKNWARIFDVSELKSVDLLNQDF